MGKKEFAFKKHINTASGKEQKSKSLNIKTMHKWDKMSKTC